MAIIVQDTNLLNRYLHGVMERADDHADNVRAIALTLVGAVLWRADPGSLVVREYAGTPANSVWFTVDGLRYAIVYNHKRHTIELRKRSQTGTVIFDFDNSVTADTVMGVFEVLGAETAAASTVDEVPSVLLSAESDASEGYAPGRPHSAAD